MKKITITGSLLTGGYKSRLMRSRVFSAIFIVPLFFIINSAFGQVNWYWVKQADSAVENASFTATDRTDDVYYTGYASGSSRVSFGNLGLNITGTQTDFLTKYNTSGVPLWARNDKALTNSASVYGMCVACDQQINVVEAGYFSDSIAFGPVRLNANGASSAAYLVKYDRNGNVLWATRPSTSSQSLAYGASTDANNNIYLAGYFTGTVVFGTYTLTAAAQNMFLAKYSPTGSVLWAVCPTLAAGATTLGLACAVDDSGDCYVSGNFSGQCTFGAYVLNPPQTEVYLAKYSSAGSPMWAINIGTTPGQVCPTPLSVDKSNNVYLASQFTNASLNIGPSVIIDNYSGNGCSNSMLAKYTHLGVPLWAVCCRNISQQQICTIVESSITTDKCRNVYWSGFCSDTFSVGCVNVETPGSNINLSQPFTYIVRLDSNGKAFSGMAFNNQSNVFFSNALATDSLNRIIFAGDLASPATLVVGNDTVKRYLSDATSFVSKYSIVPKIYGNDTICPGDSTILYVSLCTGSTYEWSTGKTGDSIRVKPNVTTTYYLTTSNCQTDTSFVTVVVQPIQARISGPDSVCKGDSITLTGSGGLTYSWSNGATTSSIRVSPPVQTIYTLTAKNGSCQADTTITVKVNPVPVPQITSSPTSDTICQGDSVMFVAGGGGTYTWGPSGSTKDTIWVKPNSSSTYTLNVSNGRCSAQTTQKITVLIRSATGLTARNDSICAAQSTYLVGTGGNSYLWLPGGSTGDSIKVTPNATTTYSVIITNRCVTDTLTKAVTVIPYPVPVISPDTTICNGGTAILSASGGDTYTWNNGATTSSITVNPLDTTTYTVTVSNGKCAHDTTISVAVANKTKGSITPAQKICLGAVITLSASGGGKYKWSTGATTNSINIIPSGDTNISVIVSTGCPDTLTTSVTVATPLLNALGDTTIVKGDTAYLGANGVGDTIFVWSPTQGLSCAVCPNPIATPTITTVYTVTAKDSLGCTLSRTVTVTVNTPCNDLFVPNVFTPNNDGINDDFVVSVDTLYPTKEPGTWADFTFYSIAIFDRWGKIVFSSTNPTQYWNGRTLNTQDLVPDGVYYYIIKATCGASPYERRGFVEVLGEK